jgi:hypothetical protein
MPGILRKFASAFVVLDDTKAGDESNRDLDHITKDAPGLLAQLDDISPADGSVEGAPGGQGASGSAMTMTADQVFQANRLADGPNAAPRLLKLIAGLSMFPREQQLMMIRAMDAADDSWTEHDVLRDAAARHEMLQQHLHATVAERDAAVQAIDSEIKRTEEGGKAVLGEIDREIAALYARREKEASETVAMRSRLEEQKQELLRVDARARQGIQQVILALGGLISFFGGAPPPPQAPRRTS